MKYSFPTLYLFNNIFFPQTVIPLTVSDATSKEVLQKCYDEGTSLTLYHPSDRSNKVGTVGKILLLEYNEDKSISALVQGIVRVRLLNQVQHIPYPVYAVEDYFDIEDGPAILDDSIERLHHVLENWLNRHISSNKERARFMKEMNSPFKLINNICLLVLKDIELKEVFLESTSLHDRIRMMDLVLRGHAPDTEDQEICQAIKNFDRLIPQERDLKNVI